MASEDTAPVHTRFMFCQFLLEIASLTGSSIVHSNSTFIAVPTLIIPGTWRQDRHTASD